MFYNLHQHREATCRRQKEAWEETILMRLKKEKQNEKGTPSNQDKKIKIPIVIWGLEASPSFFDARQRTFWCILLQPFGQKKCPKHWF